MQRKPELPPSGASRSRAPSHVTVINVPHRSGRAPVDKASVTAHPRDGPSGRAVCPLPPPRRPPGRDSRSKGHATPDSRDRGRGTSFAWWSSVATGVCPHRSGTRVPHGDVAPGRCRGGLLRAALLWGPRGELTWGFPTLSFQLPPCPALVTFPSPCGGVGVGGEAGRPAASTRIGEGSKVSCESADKCPCLLALATHLLTHVGETQEGEATGEATRRWKI